MPPQWLAIDVDPPWKGIKGQFKILRQDNSDYVFQHGDLSDRNIIIDKETLQVMALIDWEYAGYFPKGMDYWTGTLDENVCRSRVDVPAVIETFLSDEYLECYDQWPDKTQLEELVAKGEIPDPEMLRNAGASQSI